MNDPENLAYDDLLEVVRCLQATLWPNGNPDFEWSPDTIDAVAGILNDAGLGPGEEDE